MKKWPLYCANGWAWSAYFWGTAGYRFLSSHGVVVWRCQDHRRL